MASECSYVVDRAARVVRVTLSGAVTGEEFERMGLALAVEHRDAALFPRLYDMRGYTGTVRHEEVRRVNDLVLAEAGDVPRVFLVATPDPGFPLWAQAMEATLSPGRVIRVVATPEEAERELARMRDEGSAPPA